MASPVGTVAGSSKPLLAQRSAHRSLRGHYSQSPIQHIVIVVQENRSVDPQGKLAGGCDSPYGSLVGVINARGGEPKSLKTFLCFERQSLMNEMDVIGVSWKHYQAEAGAGIWHAVDAIHSIWSNKPEMKANVISPSTQVLADIANGQLADVVLVTPNTDGLRSSQVQQRLGPEPDD